MVWRKDETHGEETPNQVTHHNPQQGDAMAKTQTVEKVPQKTFNVTARITVDVTMPVAAHDFKHAAEQAAEFGTDKFITILGECLNELSIQIQGIWIE
jgi:hypothetical protein